MSFVVDCSVAVRWLLPDEATPYTDAVFDLLNEQDAIVPTLFLSEFSNVFLKLARQRKLSPTLALNAVQKFSALGLEVDRNTPASDRLFTLADQYNLSAYDATYLELALRCGVPLACWDGGLKAASEKAGLFLEIASRK